MPAARLSIVLAASASVRDAFMPGNFRMMPSWKRAALSRLICFVGRHQTLPPQAATLGR